MRRFPRLRLPRRHQILGIGGALTLGGALSIPTASLLADTSDPPLSASLLTEEGSEPLKSGQQVHTGGRVVFDARSDGSSYLYLLQVAGGQTAVLHPPAGQVLAPRQGTVRIAPWPDPHEPDRPPPPGFAADGKGEVSYLLVATSLPRDIPSDTQVRDLETFCARPPHLTSEGRPPARILGEVRLTWPPTPEPEPTPAEPVVP